MRKGSIILLVLAVIAFAARWPLDERMCNPTTWCSATQKDVDGKPLCWRPAREEGLNFFSTVFRGGGGTPAILAMFGGQRYMIANILWSYSDILFHKGKPFDMINPLEGTVTLEPSFLEAWSTYGWHLAWNLYSEVDNDVLKDRYMRMGEEVYKRAILANPRKPRPYFDIAWLYIQRTGDYQAAMAPLEYVIFGKDANGKPRFEPMTPKERKAWIDFDVLGKDRKWEPTIIGHRLAYVYRKHGIVTHDWTYIKKAADMYQMCLDIDPKDKAAADNVKQLRGNMNNEKWMAEKREQEKTLRQNFQMSPMEVYNQEVHHGHESGGEHAH